MDVDLHTKLKHRIISYYFSSGWRQVLKGGNVYSLYYIDLFAGDGECRCDRINEEIEQYLPENLKDRVWDPPFFKLMEIAKEANFNNLSCFFNDIDRNKIESLKEKIKERDFSDFVGGYYCKDANIICEELLEKIGKPNRPSIFLLDPQNHSQLKFSTIEKIANFTDKNTGRKPELIINFMFYSILMAFKRGLPEKDVDDINAFLGTNFGRKELLELKESASRKTYEVLLNVFIKNLKELGYLCNYQLVASTKTNSPIYYLVFAAYDKKIFQWYKRVNDYVEKLKEDWIKKNYTILTMSEMRKKGQRFLPEFY